MTRLAAILVPMLLAASPAAGPLSPGSVMPPLRGELLTGAEAELPAAIAGKVALLAFGFTRGSSEDVKAWGARFKASYGSDTMLTWVEVPVMGGIARMMRGVITGAMRKETPEPDRTHLMTVWSDADAWKRRLAVSAGKPAYLLLLDREGIVRWKGSGPLNEETWRTLAAVTDSLR
jgi:hypothetical protein